MRKTLCTLILVPLFVTGILSAQALVIPQAPDGAGWSFTLVATNTTTSSAIVSISFTNGATGEGWLPPLVESVNLSALEVAPASSMFIHSTGTAATLTQGWAQIIGNSGVQAYIIYTYTSGNSSSSATAQAVTASSASLVPFDNTATATGTNGTEFAIMNPNQQPVTINANFSIVGGTGTAGSAITVPGNQQKAVVMATQFSATAGQSGLAEFYSTDGSFAIIALRSNTNSTTGLFAFTSAPTYPDAGAPIITTSGSGGGGGGGTSGPGGPVPAGDITFAGFSIGKTTALGIVSEHIGGQFGEYTPAEWDPPYQGTRIAPYCSVYSASYTYGTTFPYSPLVFLDAGKSLSLKGPSLPAADTTLLASTISGVTGPEYVLQQLTAGTLVDGGTYTLSGTGGTQVDAFSASATLPSNFSTNLTSISGVNRSQPLAVSWTGSGFETVIIGVISATVSGMTYTQTVLSCAVPANLNTYSIPTAALSHLSATSGGILTLSTAPTAVGPTSPTSGQPTSLTPGLVQGGKIEYGAFTPTYSEVTTVPIT